jgi:hypothetical protein
VELVPISHYLVTTTYSRSEATGLTWSATTLGGAHRDSHQNSCNTRRIIIVHPYNLEHHFAFCSPIPTFYIAFIENQSDGGGSFALLGITQLFISVVVTRLFSMLPSDRMFGYVSPAVAQLSHTFPDRYSVPHSPVRLGRVFVWFLVVH